MHGVTLGGVFTAISQGAPAGISALILGLQPIVTSLLANRFMGEKITRVQSVGLATRQSRYCKAYRKRKCYLARSGTSKALGFTIPATMLARADEVIAGAESFYSLEGNMCGTAMRGADALSGSKATSRAKGSHRKLGGLGFDRNGTVVVARIGKVRSRSR